MNFLLDFVIVKNDNTHGGINVVAASEHKYLSPLFLRL